MKPKQKRSSHRNPAKFSLESIVSDIYQGVNFDGNLNSDWMLAMITYMGRNFTRENGASKENESPVQLFQPIFHQGTDVKPSDIGLRIIRDQVEKYLHAELEENRLFLDGAFSYLAGIRDQGGKLLEQFRDTYGAAKLRLLFKEFRDRLDYLRNESSTALRSITNSNRRALAEQGIPLRETVYSALFHVHDNNYRVLMRKNYALTKDCDDVHDAAIAHDNRAHQSSHSKTIDFNGVVAFFARAISSGAYKPKK